MKTLLIAVLLLLGPLMQGQQEYSSFTVHNGYVVSSYMDEAMSIPFLCTGSEDGLYCKPAISLPEPRSLSNFNNVAEVLILR